MLRRGGNVGDSICRLFTRPPEPVNAAVRGAPKGSGGGGGHVGFLTFDDKREELWVKARFGSCCHFQTFGKVRACC